MNDNNDNVKRLEDLLVSKGKVSVVGCGRLGIRVVMDLIEVHRGGPEKIYVFDNGIIESNDIIHRKFGGILGEYKVKLPERFYSEKVVGIPENITEDNIEILKGDVILLCMAGGDTLKLREKIVNYAFERGIKTIGTDGVFGIDENVKVYDGKYSTGPVSYMNIEKEGHTVVGTGKFIKDRDVITPYTLEEVSKKMVIECLRYLRSKYR